MRVLQKPLASPEAAPSPASGGHLSRRRRTRIHRTRGPSPFGGPRTYARDHNPELSALLASRVDAITEYATRIGREARHFVFTSRLQGADEEILRDLIRAFCVMKRTRVFRRIPAAVWALADHDRPHLHLAAVVPTGITIRDIRRAWSAGQSTHPRAIYDGAGLGLYFASQRAAGPAKLPSRHRFHGWRAPPTGHFTSIYMGKAQSSPSPLPIHSLGAEGSTSHGAPGCAPTCAPRAAAGGDTGSASATAGAASGGRTRRRVSAGERPQAEGHRTTATVGAEVGLESPPRGSEQRAPTIPGVVPDTTSRGVLPGRATFQSRATRR